jgi:hypothetical protein
MKRFHESAGGKLRSLPSDGQTGSYAEDGTLIRGRWELSGPRKTKTRQQGKLIVPARILVQTYAAKKILETGITMQAVEHQVRF